MVYSNQTEYPASFESLRLLFSYQTSGGLFVPHRINRITIFHSNKEDCRALFFSKERRLGYFIPRQTKGISALYFTAARIYYGTFSPRNQTVSSASHPSLPILIYPSVSCHGIFKLRQNGERSICLSSR